MNRRLPAAVSDWQLRQAIVLLDGEQLSPSERRRFAWLNRSVWSVLVLSLAWPVVLFTAGSLHKIPLFLLLAAGGGVIGFFLANLTLLWKCVRVARMELRLGIWKYVSTLAAKIAGEQRDRVRTWTGSLVLGAVGGGLVLLSALALSEEYRLSGLAMHDESAFRYIVGNAAVLTFGLACLSLIPLKLIQRRLDAIARLRQALLGQPAGRDAVLTSAQHKFMATIERTQILVARDEAAKASRSKEGAGRVRFAPSFQDSLAGLEAEEVASVYAAVGDLLRHLQARPAADAEGEGERFEVPGTTLAIEFRQDADNGEVLAYGLSRSRQAVEPVDDQGPTP